MSARHPIAPPAGATPAHDALDGRWDVQRVSGLLPPMAGVRKRVEGSEGRTTLAGFLHLPFTVTREPGGSARIVYRAPLAMIADELTPDGQGGWNGTSRLAGITIGRFRMRRR